MFLFWGGPFHEGGDLLADPITLRSSWGRSIPRGWGSTGEGLCALHEGPTYRECTRPSRSSIRPSCSARPRLARRLRATASAMSGEPADDFTPGSSPHWSLSARRNQDLRSRTRLMRCSASLVRTRVARPRVGAMFSRRLTRLTLSQISFAPARATSSGISAKRRK